MAKPKPGRRRPRKRERKNISVGVCHIRCSFNNTIVSITDTEGNVISWASGGGGRLQGVAQEHPVRRRHGRRDRRQGGDGARPAQGRGAGQGPGSGRDTAIRSLQNVGIEVSSIKDVTPVPHNGCRSPKRKRN